MWPPPLHNQRFADSLAGQNIVQCHSFNAATRIMMRGIHKVLDGLASDDRAKMVRTTGIEPV